MQPSTFLSPNPLVSQPCAGRARGHCRSWACALEEHLLCAEKMKLRVGGMEKKGTLRESSVRGTDHERAPVGGCCPGRAGEERGEPGVPSPGQGLRSSLSSGPSCRGSRQQDPTRVKVLWPGWCFPVALRSEVRGDGLPLKQLGWQSVFFACAREQSQGIGL